MAMLSCLEKISYLVGGFEHVFICPLSWEESSQLTNIFQRGWNHQPDINIISHMLHGICTNIYSKNHPEFWRGEYVSSPGACDADQPGGPGFEARAWYGLSMIFGVPSVIIWFHMISLIYTDPKKKTAVWGFMNPWLIISDFESSSTSGVCWLVWIHVNTPGDGESMWGIPHFSDKLKCSTYG